MPSHHIDIVIVLMAYLTMKFYTCFSVMGFLV